VPTTDHRGIIFVKFVVRHSAVVAIIALLLVSGTAAPAAAGTGSRCREVSLPVSITAGTPTDLFVRGTLCTPAGGGRTIQVLVPPGTYDRSYWLMPGKYSYANALLSRGYAVLAFDRLGSGRSSKPASSGFVRDSHQNTLRQVLEAVRDGRFGPFGKLVAVGNSVGSTLIRSVVIAHPGLADGIILTGEADAPSMSAFEQFAGELHAPTEDPVLGRDPDLDEGYYTTKPGARKRWFYHQPGAEPWVIVRDELTKQPDVHIQDFPLPQENQAIRVPVLIMVGQYDRLLCAADGTDCSSSEVLYQQEKQWYPHTSLETVVMPGTGHVLNMHRTAPRAYEITRDWMDRHIGR
jgi:pimeloyl-ACP methyl ester carboxylesterase